ncbi:hypothetical protein ECZU51_11580 [Escherichia coli]|nr:hypothetical protein ECZU51_11580 [Escherichia coli]
MLKIIRAGMYTTVQDGGRHGFRQSGISHCGALDMPALRIANLLVGNDANAPALEITLGQLTVEFETDGWFALTGPVAKRGWMITPFDRLAIADESRSAFNA